MKRSEAISAYYEQVAHAMVTMYSSVLLWEGRFQYSMYIREDGVIEVLEDFQGGNGSLWPTEEGEPRRFYVTTIGRNRIDPWECADRARPENTDEAEKELDEIIEWLTDEYEANVTDVLDSIIEEAKKEERHLAEND